jgi:putative lipoprotein
MRPVIYIFLALGLSGLLTACGGPQKQANFEPLMTVPSVRADPGDEVLRAAVKSFLAESGAPAASTYTFRRFDLDSDGRRDALVIFGTPYGYWCGLYGCTMLVMKAEDEDFTLVSTVQTVREPLFVSDITTNGWKNIIVHISGRWEKTKDVALQFDGKSYPVNPSELPSYLQLASNSGTKLFYD